MVKLILDRTVREMVDAAMRLNRLRGLKRRISDFIQTCVLFDYFLVLIRLCFRYRKTVALLLISLASVALVSFYRVNFQSENDVCPIPMDKHYIRGQLFDGSRNKNSSLFQVPPDDYFQVSVFAMHF